MNAYFVKLLNDTLRENMEKYKSFFKEEYKFDLLQEFEEIAQGVLDSIIESKYTKKDNEITVITTISSEEIFACCADSIKAGSKFSYINELYALVSMSEKERQNYFIESVMKPNPDYLDQLRDNIGDGNKYAKTSFAFKGNNLVITINI